ncbi:MAG TPA: hypothetical protein VFR04_06825 [Solirubrobacterales bacterium]|nr:hypothetical protein [Solirubrobacterales bacterium]
MTADAAAGVPVAFAEGVLDDVRELTAISSEDDHEQVVEAEALKQRVAELLVECKGNPFLGEPMGPGLHPELANCRRVRFDIPSYSGKPRFRLIYRNEPTDGAPAECRWLTVAPRAGLRAHRKARQRLGRD